jgi:hypothetical protein
MDFTFARATGGRAVFPVFASPDERVRRDQHHDGASGNHVPCRARKRSSSSGTHFWEDAQAAVHSAYDRGPGENADVALRHRQSAHRLSTLIMPTRFLFDPPRRLKVKAGPNIKSLLVRCPSTSKLTDTGRTIEEKRWRRTKLKTQRFTCAHCGGVHSWKRKTLFLHGRRQRAIDAPQNSRVLIFRIPINRINWTTSSFLIGTICSHTHRGASN